MEAAEPSVQRPRPIDEVERLRLYLVDTRAWCRHCNHELKVEMSPRCPGCARILTTRDVTAAPRTFATRLAEQAGAIIRRRYQPAPVRRSIQRLRPARDSRAAGPLTDDERIRLYLLEHDAECPHCGYDLFGLESATCPECGQGLTITALRRGRRRWLTPAFIAGLIPLALVTAASLALPVRAVMWLPLEYRMTFISVFVAIPAILPILGFAWLFVKWVNYAQVMSRMPRPEHWLLVLACWLALGLVVLVVRI